MIHIGSGCDKPGRKLCGEIDLVSVSVLQSTANKGLAFPVMIGISCINVIHAMINGISDHRRCLFFIDISIFLDRQAHASESENRQVD